jgi:hypothetical protein
MLIPVGLMAIGGVSMLGRRDAPPPEPIKIYPEVDAATWLKKMEIYALFESVKQNEEKEQAQRSFDASPEGKRIRELELRVEDAESRANFAIGIAAGANIK